MDNLSPQILLPCPFCGGKAELFQRELFGSDHDYSKDDDNWDVRCADGNCYLADGGDWWLIKEEAVEIWNKRNALTPKSDTCICDYLADNEEVPDGIKNQIALQKWDKYVDYGKVNAGDKVSFGRWLSQQEDSDE